MEIQNSYGGQVSGSQHCGHRAGGADSGGASVTVQRKLTVEVAAALRKRLGSAVGAASASTDTSTDPLQSLVSMLQSAVSGSAASGSGASGSIASGSTTASSDAVPDLLNAIRDAFSSARKLLTNSGVSEQEANKAVASVSQQLGQALAAPVATTTTAVPPPDVVLPETPFVGDLVAPPASARNYNATYVRTEKASLDILTQEGDRVQILFRSRQGIAMQSGAVANDASGGDAAATDAVTNSNIVNTAGAAPAGSKLYAFASGRVQVAVQGDLSADELKAIGELVGKVDGFANQFFQGDIQQGFASAAAIGFDPAQIAGFALKMSLQETYRQSGTPPAATPVVAKPIAVTTNPISTTPSSDAPRSTASTDTVTPVSAAATTVDTAAKTATPAVTAVAPAATSDASTPVGTLQSTLAAFVRKILDGVSQSSGAGRIEFSMRWKLNLVVAAVEAGAQKATASTALNTASTASAASASPTTSDPAAVKLLTNSLQSAATLASAGDTAGSF